MYTPPPPLPPPKNGSCLNERIVVISRAAARRLVILKLVRAIALMVTTICSFKHEAIFLGGGGRGLSTLLPMAIPYFALEPVTQKSET